MMFARPGSYALGRTTTLTPVGTVPAYVPGSANPVSVRQPLNVVTVLSSCHASAVESPNHVFPLHVWPLRFPMFPSMPPSEKSYSVFPDTVAVSHGPRCVHPPMK